MKSLESWKLISLLTIIVFSTTESDLKEKQMVVAKLGLGLSINLHVFGVGQHNWTGHNWTGAKFASLGVAPGIREIYSSCDFSSFLPSCLFSCAPAQAKRGDNFTHNGSKDAFWREEVPAPSKCFSLIWRFGGHFAPKPPKFRLPVGKSQPNKKV